MVITSFSINNKDEMSSFFEKTFLLADISMNIAFRMIFLTLSNIKVNFTKQKLKQKLYIIAKTFSTTRSIKRFGKKEFGIVIFDLDNKNFVVYITILINSDLDLEIHPYHRAHIAFLKVDKALISIFFKYANFLNVFSKDLIAKFSKNRKINNHTINLVED